MVEGSTPLTGESKFTLRPVEHKPQQRYRKNTEIETRHLTKARCYVELKLFRTLTDKKITKIEISENNKSGASILILFGDGSYARI